MYIYIVYIPYILYIVYVYPDRLANPDTVWLHSLAFNVFRISAGEKDFSTCQWFVLGCLALQSFRSVLSVGRK